MPALSPVKIPSISYEFGRLSFNFEAAEPEGCGAVFLYCYCSTVVCDVTVAVVLDWGHS